MHPLLSRITLNSEVCHGKPTIRNTRYLVDAILEYMAGGDSVDDIIQAFPDLEQADVFACIAFAAASMKLKDIGVKAA